MYRKRSRLLQPPRLGNFSIAQRYLGTLAHSRLVKYPSAKIPIVGTKKKHTLEQAIIQATNALEIRRDGSVLVGWARKIV